MFFSVPIVVSDATRNIPATQPSSSHHPPGAVSYNVTLRQHQAPPGAYGGKAGDHRMAEARGREQGNQSDKRNHVNNSSTHGNSSSKFPYRVYEMSLGDKAEKGEQDQSEFAFREFDRLDILLNLSLIHRKRALDISRYLIEIGKTTIEAGQRMVQIHSGNKTRTENYKSTVKIARRLISAGKKILARGEKVLKAVLRPTSEKPLKAHEPKVPATRISDLQVVTPVIKMISLCSHGPSYYGVTLLGGIRAGHFVSHGRVDNMPACIKKCCANHECDLAFMVKEDCYSVICYHKSLCRSVRAQHIRKYKPRIAHIWRGSNKGKESVTGHARSRQPSRKHMKSTGKSKFALVKHKEEESVTRNAMSLLMTQNHTKKTKARKQVHQHKEKVTQKHISTNGVDSHLSSSVPDSHSSTDEKSRLNARFEEGLTQKSYLRSSQGHTASKALATEPSTPIESSKNDSQVKKESIKATNSTRQIHSLGLKGGNSTVYKGESSQKHPVLKKSNNACPHSPVEHNVGLRHGLKTGKFSYIGELFDIEKCLDVCCHEPDCDIAFMLDQSCYTVNCTNESACRSVPYHQHQYSTKAVFVFRRFNKQKSRFGGIQRVASLGRNTVPTLSSNKAFTESNVVIPTVAQASNIETHHNRTSHVQNFDVENGPELWQDEKIKINLTGAQHFTPKGNESDRVEIRSNKSANEKWRNEKIRVHLLNVDNVESRSSSLRQKSNLTLDRLMTDKLIPGNSQVDTRNKVPKTNSKPHVSVTSHSYLVVGGKRMESTAEKENDVERKGSSTNESALSQKGSLKIKVTLGSGDSLLQGEPDYYKSQSQTRKFFDPYARENSESVAKTEEDSGRVGPGMSGSAELEIGNEHDTSSGQYENGSSLYETSSTFDLSYPESNETVEDYTSQVSAKPESQNCSSSSYYNVTLKGGLQAGNFTFAGRVSSKEDCVTRCCSTTGCDLTFMVLDRCFLVDCYGDDLCDVTEARNADKFEPVISYVNLTIIDTLARSHENSSLTSIVKIDDTYVNQTSSKEAERSHNVGSIKTGTNRMHNTPWTQSHDTILPTDIHQSGCLYSAPFHNISFRLGRQAGSFTNQGTAKNIHECSQWCCQSKHCDVAFMISKDCFLVRCHSNKSCETFTIRGSKFNPRMVFVKKHRVQLDAQRENRTVNTANGVVANQPNGSQLSETIPTSATIYTVNKSSDNYGPFSSSDSLSVSATDKLLAPHNLIATKAPVLDVNSSVASGTSKDDTGPEATQPVSKDDPSNFVEVKTNGSEFWWQYYKPEDIHLSNSSFKVELPDVSENTRNSTAIASSGSAPQTLRGTHSQNQDKQELCSHAKIVNGVTLTGGYYAGIFTRQDNVTNMKQCISRCCRLSKCNVAFMVSKICYAVECFSNEKCTTVKAHYASRYHPQVSYIRRGPINTSPDEVKYHVTDHDLVTDKFRCVLDDISAAKYTVQKGSVLVHSSAQDMGDCAKLCCQTRGCEVALRDNGTCYSLNCHGNLTCPNTNLSRDGQFSSRPLVVIKDVLQTQTNSERVHTEACDFSNVLHEVVLRGGSQSGKFKYLIEVENMDTCIKECCRHKVCDLALMLKDNCFLVSCHNEMLCDPIASRSSDYHPQMAYKIKHGKRRHIGKDVSYLHRVQTV